MRKPIYLDYNGTTPHDPEVIRAMLPYLETEFGNPSSNHLYGVGPKRAIDKAREQVAQLLNCNHEEVIFTSGGTESNNHAITGTAFAMRHKGNHIITSVFEHPAVLEVCRHLEICGFKVTYLPVDKEGLVSMDFLRKAILPETILITVMHANNEVGTVQPISEISTIAKTHGIIVHTDAAQSAGKISIKTDELGIDLLSIAGHKLYAPKGIGALYIRHPIQPAKFCHGAGQERGMRAGTENVLEIVGLGKACEIACQNLFENEAKMKTLRDRLYKGLKNQIRNMKLNGHTENRLPNTLSLSFKNVEANRLLEEIGLEIAASPGAACHSDTVEISHVLKAMSIPIDWAKGTLRFSVGRMTTKEEVDKAVKVVSDAVNCYH